MMDLALGFADLLAFMNMAMTSVLVILTFSLLAYTLTYNFGHPVARRFAGLLTCVMIAYASEVALTRVLSPESAARWLRFEWLGIAMLPAAYYVFSLSVLRTTNYPVRRRSWVAAAMVAFSTASAASALAGGHLVGDVHFAPPISYLEAGPYFALFTVYFGVAVVLSLGNIWKARQRCLTQSSRQRMTYLLLGFIAPGVGVFPYLIGLSRLSVTTQSSASVLVLSLIGNAAVAVMLILMSYTVAYFGVLTPDRVVRYRLIRFVTRGPAVAILVILAIQTVPTIERALGLPRDIVLFSVITGVIITSQLILSVTKTWVDRLIYREDREEIAWLRELDRRLLTTSDLRQFLENNLIALCELLRVDAGFVAAVVGPDLMLEAVIGPDSTRPQVTAVTDWTEVLGRLLRRQGGALLQPVSHGGFWVWALTAPADDDAPRVLGMLGVAARTAAPLLSHEEVSVLGKMLDSVTRALVDRRLQQSVFVSLRRIIPDIDRVQQARGRVPYLAVEGQETPASALLDPSPIHSPEFEVWVKDALSHYWGGPKLTLSPLVELRVVNDSLDQADHDPTKALRLVLGNAIDRLRPQGKQNLSAPEWLLYNILEMRFIQGRKVRDIADRLAISESDLYRKQRVAIGQVARVLAEMEQDNSAELTAPAEMPLPAPSAPANAGVAEQALAANGSQPVRSP